MLFFKVISAAIVALKVNDYVQARSDVSQIVRLVIVLATLVVYFFLEGPWGVPSELYSQRGITALLISAALTVGPIAWFIVAEWKSRFGRSTG